MNSGVFDSRVCSYPHSPSYYFPLQETPLVLNKDLTLKARFFLNCMRGDPQKWNCLLEGRPLIVQTSLLGECSINSSISVYQLALLWEAASGFSEFLFEDSTCSPISCRWFMSSPAHTTLNVQHFMNKGVMTPVSHPPIHLILPWVIFLFPRMKKVLKGKHFADVEDVKQKWLKL